MDNLSLKKKYACLKCSFKTSPIGTHPVPGYRNSRVAIASDPQRPARRDGVSDLSAQELYLTMLSMAAMMKNIKMGSRRIYWDRVRHPLSEKHELSSQKGNQRWAP